MEAARASTADQSEEPLMPRMTGSRAFAEMMKGYGIDHIFFVPAIMSKALAEMEDMPKNRPPTWPTVMRAQAAG